MSVNNKYQTISTVKSCIVDKNSCVNNPDEFIEQITLNISGPWHDFQVLAIISQLIVWSHNTNYRNLKSALN